ncbi:MAG: hypothetical protein KKF93_02590 [Candidatus Omnitrophica bacterium]|nr:hypothetical protein [Candidatus Omnitrophota bacterium]
MEKKKAYRKPDISEIKLVPEETLLSGCKQVSGAGGKTNKCPPLGSGCKSDNGS